MRVTKRAKRATGTLSMPKGQLNARVEFALMTGYVISVRPEDLEYVLGYAASAVLCNADKDTHKEVAAEIMERVTKSHDKRDVKYVVFNTVMDMPCVTLLIDVEGYSELPYDACDLVNDPSHRFNGASYWYGFTYNFSVPYLSGFGDSFFEDAGSGFIHRVS